MRVSGLSGQHTQKPGNMCLGIGDEVIDDPCHRQVGDDRIVLVQAFQVDAYLCDAANIVEGQHHTLGLSGCT
jgi:hypothetical protein